jgi:hypothetical protein
MSKALSLQVLLLFSVVSVAQTTTTYQASTGTVSPGNMVTAHLDLGGSFVSPHGMGGPNCYYGTCFVDFSGYQLSYVLPDGTTFSTGAYPGTPGTFSGTFDARNQFDVKIQGTASGVDSTGVSVTVTISWEWAARCRSGRGGGCTKKFLDGTLTVTK